MEGKYYGQKAPPVRENRLNAGDGFAGKCCASLLESGRGGLLTQTCRDFWQGNACQMSLTLMMATTIEKAAIVLHGPVGCGSNMHNLGPAVHKGKKCRGLVPAPLRWLSTNLTEGDIIGGGEAKLMEAILYADREFRPEIIFVVSTCAPSVIGDDADEIVTRAGAGTRARVVLLDCPGFKSRVVASAYDAFYHGLIRYLPLEGGPGAGKKGLGPADGARAVNVFNSTSIGQVDEAEIARLLGELGLRARFYAEYSNAGKFRGLTGAALNVSLCDIHDDYMLGFLWQRFGMPYVMGGMPIGYGGTRGWLESVAGPLGLGREAGEVADREEGRLRATVEPLLAGLRGKRVLSVGGIARVMAVSMALKELGLEPIGFHAYHYDDTAIPLLERTQAELPDLPVAVSSQDFELFGAVRKFGPDLVISHSGTQGLLAKMGVPAIQLYDVDRPCLGYKGLHSLAKRIAFAFANVSFQKRLAAKARFPYNKEWPKHDPYGHIKTT
ncbi:MAG: nitrogenase component 1 [Deltaproteobacteria bacterium]|jgi:nitrogenase molybdenum-iron protein alpha chain|nr:nitrogenase component 1 [Deltaproteobacteria bacterium]